METSAVTRTRARRQRNARGQGARLSEEIVHAAMALIDRSGSQESVTLRAIAREIGIAAPSIYPHFEDRDAILLAVVARLFDELSAAIRGGVAAAGDDPVDQLVAGCDAYVSFGLQHPARYGVLFSGSRPPDTAAYAEPDVAGPGEHPLAGLGADAFALLVDAIARCVEAGASASADVTGDATAVWVALHGAVTLRTALPAFPWPEPASAFVRQLVLPLAKIARPG